MTTDQQFLIDDLHEQAVRTLGKEFVHITNDPDPDGKTMRVHGKINGKDVVLQGHYTRDTTGTRILNMTKFLGKEDELRERIEEQKQKMQAVELELITLQEQLAASFMIGECVRFFHPHEAIQDWVYGTVHELDGVIVVVNVNYEDHRTEYKVEAERIERL